MKNFYRLWQAEQTKTQRLTRRFYALMILVGIIFVVPQLIIVMQIKEGIVDPNILPFSKLQLAYPFTFQIILLTFFGVAPNSFLGLFIAIVYASLITYGEYQSDTWKMILPRRSARVDFLLVKFLRCAYVFLIVIFVGGFLIQLLAIGTAALLHLPIMATVPDRVLDLSVLYSSPDTYFSQTVPVGALVSYSVGLAVLGLVAWLKMLFWALVAMLMTIGLRSAVVGILGTFIFSQGILIFSALPFMRPIAGWIPSTDLEYALSALSNGDGKFGNLPILRYPQPIFLAVSIGIVGIVALFGLTAVIFKRQEIM